MHRGETTRLPQPHDTPTTEPVRARAPHEATLTRAATAWPPRHVYVHVPFCTRRCSYCDFSIAVRARVPVAEFVEGITREMALRFPSGPWNADTLYLGGGTPSKLGGEGVAALIGTLRKRITLAGDAEVTIEANPEDITADAVRAWRGAGVNRLSIGAQSFDDSVLAWMHRSHDAARIGEAVRVARGEGIPSFSLDLIFALPESLKRDWRRDVELALTLEPSHVTLYGLTIEPATPLHRWRDRGVVAEAVEETYAAEYVLAHELATAAGLTHYEVSNFGRAGQRARHNSSYWALVPYAGLGPSSHEFDGERRRWNVAPYAEWLARVSEGSDPVAGSEHLTAEQRVEEEAYLGLRTDDGLALQPGEWALAAPWIAAGWARRAGDRLALTPEGWLRMDAIVLTIVRSRL